jgi:hypothetical protein
MTRIAILVLAGGLVASNSAAPATAAQSAPAAQPTGPEVQAQGNASATGSGNAGQIAGKSLASGTKVNATLSHSVDARKNKPADRVTARTTDPTWSNGLVVLPKGTLLVGHVSQAHPRGKGESESALAIVFDKAVLKDGYEVPLDVTIQAIAAPPVTASTSLGDEGLAPSGGAGNAASAPSRAGGRGAMGGGAPGNVANTASNAGGVAGGAAGTTANAGGVPDGAVNSTTDPNATGNGPLGSAGSIAGSTKGAARGLGSGLDDAGQLTANSQGVFGLNGISLSSAASAGAEGSLITSAGRNVHLDSGTQLLLAVNDTQ